MTFSPSKEGRGRFCFKGQGMETGKEVASLMQGAQLLACSAFHPRCRSPFAVPFRLIDTVDDRGELRHLKQLLYTQLLLHSGKTPCSDRV